MWGLVAWLMRLLAIEHSMQRAAAGGDERSVATAGLPAKVPTAARALVAASACAAGSLPRPENSEPAANSHTSSMRCIHSGIVSASCPGLGDPVQRVPNNRLMAIEGNLTGLFHGLLRAAPCLPR